MQRWRRLLWALLAVALCLCACAPATAAQPTATPEASIQPAAPAAPSQPMILVLPSYRQTSMIAVNRHYSTVLKNKGWNIDLYTVLDEYADDDDGSYTQYVSTQLASGVAKADGYFLRSIQTGSARQAFDDLKSKGLLMDCTLVAQQAAPDYWARWKDRIAGSPYGLPLCREGVNTDDGYMLCVRQGTVGQIKEPPNSFSDIRTLLKRLAKPAAQDSQQATAGPTGLSPSGFRLSVSMREWLDCWALEQGYMPIDESNFVYVGMDDAGAQPVLLEDIPGFAAFLEDYLELRSQGVLYDARTNAGIAGDAPNGWLLQTGYLYNVDINGFTLQDYTSYPLYRGQEHGHSLWTAYLLENPEWLNSYVLTIPAASRRAADAVAFVQWATASQGNADALLYGQQGEDYTLQGERVALKGPIRGIASGILNDSNLNLYSIYSLFSTFVQGHLPAEAPSNAESMLAAEQPRPLAAPWLTDLAYYRYDSVIGEDVPPNDLTSSRLNDLQLFYNLLYDYTSALPTGKELLKSFHSKDSNALLQWYQQRIDRARAKAGR